MIKIHPYDKHIAFNTFLMALFSYLIQTIAFECRNVQICSIQTFGR